MTATKLIPTVLVAIVLVASVAARPPRSETRPGELVRLVLAVTLLYLVGGAALLWHRTDLAGIVFGAGLALCGLALWLSRGSSPPPPEDGGGGGEDPPPNPVPPPEFDWSFYEEEFREPVA